MPYYTETRDFLPSRHVFPEEKYYQYNSIRVDPNMRETVWDYSGGKALTIRYPGGGGACIELKKIIVP